ncbi:MAG: hypothetical protein MJB57_14710 [Gemmatimonadetes bacterium]|nr:hypothetical protein [Gemmatimonadota bacterium]
MTAPTDGSPRIVLWMAVFVVIGAPFVYLVWDFVNELLSGRFELSTAGLALVGLGGGLLVLRLVARRAAVWEATHPPRQTRSSDPAASKGDAA